MFFAFMAIRIGKYILVVLAICLFLVSRAYAYENLVYIWQRDWNEFVQDGISKIQPGISKFIVLCGDFRYENGKPSINAVDIDWSYFREKDIEITLAFRINTETKELLQTDGAFKVADGIKTVFDRVIESATNNGVKVIDIQIDYDCPTSKLADYSNFIRICKERFPEQRISITALPTWLDSKDFKELIKHTSYYVLQLHSFEIPKTADKARQIFLKDEAPSYIFQASQLGHPYYISLPTYGYEAAFGQDGQFLGIRAEVNPVTLGKDMQYQTVISEPVEILSFLREIQQVKPQKFLGVCWFRMPIKTDEFNWHINTLKAVLENRVPVAKVNAEIKTLQDGLCEVYLVNNGEKNILAPISFTVNWQKGSSPLYDVLGRYEGRALSNGNGIEITGFPPKVGNKILVAWIRYPKTTHTNNATYLSEVVINETSK